MSHLDPLPASSLPGPLSHSNAILNYPSVSSVSVPHSHPHTLQQQYPQQGLNPSQLQSSQPSLIQPHSSHLSSQPPHQSNQALQQQQQQQHQHPHQQSHPLLHQLHSTATPVAQHPSSSQPPSHPHPS